MELLNVTTPNNCLDTVLYCQVPAERFVMFIMLHFIVTQITKLTDDYVSIQILTLVICSHEIKSHSD